MITYKLVPVEPTPEMASEGARHLQIMSLPEREAASVFRAMLAAAPVVQGEQVSHDWDDQDKCRRCGDRDWYASATCTPKPAPNTALVEAFDAGRRAAQAEAVELAGALSAMLDEASSAGYGYATETVLRAVEALAAYRRQRGEP